MRTFFAILKRYYISIFPSTAHDHYLVCNAVDRNSLYDILDAGDYNN